MSGTQKELAALARELTNELKCKLYQPSALRRAEWTCLCGVFNFITAPMAAPVPR